MAVNGVPTPPAMVRDYWPRYRRKAITLTVIIEVLLTVTIGGALVGGGMFDMTLTFFVGLVGVLLAACSINLLLLSRLLAPLKDLSTALTHAAGEPTVTTPPNPNSDQYQKTGFKKLLQVIYALDSSDKAVPAGTVSAASAVELSTALDASDAGIIMLGQNREVVYANKAAPVHLDNDNKMVVDLLYENGDTLEAWLNDCEERAVHATHSWSRVADKITGEENRRIFDVVGSYQKGSQAEVILTLFDRTISYQPEDDNLDFIAFAAHELRGPITVIRGYLDVLSDELSPVLQDDQAELLQRLVVSANRLSSYVNNILNASRYDRRHLKVHLSEDSLAGIYDTIRDDMQLRASSQNRLLSVNLPADLPTVAADRASVSEVIGNLIDNAIKYSNEGGTVNVTAATEGDFVKTYVEDHGIGMPGNVVSNLFHKFYRSHRSRETVAGTGIGLYICKAIVESHGGKIGVRSVEGQGSVFEFSLPIYATVADKLRQSDNSNEGMIDHGEGWIKNHSMYRG